MWRKWGQSPISEILHYAIFLETTKVVCSFPFVSCQTTGGVGRMAAQGACAGRAS